MPNGQSGESGKNVHVSREKTTECCVAALASRRLLLLMCRTAKNLIGEDDAMATTARPRRSVLYMPGSNARALEKAKTLGADGLIFDLEDAVAPDAKDEARRLVVAAVQGGGYGQREILVRANGLGTPWGYADVVAAATSGAATTTLGKGSVLTGFGPHAVKGARLAQSDAAIRARLIIFKGLGLQIGVRRALCLKFRGICALILL